MSLVRHDNNPFVVLPIEIWMMISPFLTDKQLARLLLISKESGNIIRVQMLPPRISCKLVEFAFFNEQKKIQNILYNKNQLSLYPLNLDQKENIVLNLLLHHIAYGQQEEAEALVKKNPELLRLKGDVIDYSGHMDKDVTPLQLAIRKGDDNMWQMLEKYFEKLEKGQEEKARQFNEEFPDGKLPEQKPYDFDSLVQEITQASAEDINAMLDKKQNDSKLCKALNEFRKAFTELSMKEKHFNPQHLIQAFTVYNQQFNNWDWDKLDLFWRQVVGYVQRFLPSCYAQAFSQGLYYIVDKKEFLARTFNFRFGGVSFFPLISDSSSGLGFDLAGDSGGCGGGRPQGFGGLVFSFLIDYVEQKQENWNLLSAVCRTQRRSLGV